MVLAPMIVARSKVVMQTGVFESLVYFAVAYFAVAGKCCAFHVQPSCVRLLVLVLMRWLVCVCHTAADVLVLLREGGGCGWDGGHLAVELLRAVVACMCGEG